MNTRVKKWLVYVEGGVTGAGFKVMGSLGKGVSALSSNKDYQKKRQKSFAKPTRNVQEGFVRAGRRLVIVSYVFHCH